MAESRESLPVEAVGVLAFWFGEMSEETWWKPPEHVDGTIRERFWELYERFVRDGVPMAWLSSPQARLAAIVILDQFPRNLFRDDPRAFGTDDHALALAKKAIELGDETNLSLNQRIFLYMPLQHSEDANDQACSVELAASLGNPKILDYANMHADVIKRFGRFPHRNAVLGRVSTPDEVEFLRTPGLFW